MLAHGNTFEIHRSTARLYGTWRVAGMCVEKEGGDEVRQPVTFLKPLMQEAQ